MKNFPTPREMAAETMKRWAMDSDAKRAELESSREHFAESVRWDLVKAASMLIQGDLMPLTRDEQAALEQLLRVFDNVSARVKQERCDARF